MKNVKKRLFFGATLLTATFAVAAFATTTHEGFAKVAKSIDNARWNHYSAVGATLDSKGSREFWVSCESHGHQFTEPDSANIVDMGAPSQQFIDSLDGNDDRLVEKTWKVISFENDSDINLVSSLRNNFSVKEVVDTAGATDGSHALKLMWKDGTGDFAIAKSYLDIAFADPGVTAVKFDAKGSVAFIEMKYVTNTTGASGDVTGRYESRTDDGYGLTTEWKTFVWTRQFYNNLVAYPTQYSTIKHAFFWSNINSIYTTFEFYLDNIRPVYNSDTINSFEGGRLITGTAVDFRDFDNKQVLTTEFQNGIDNYSYSFDYSVKSEGNRSIKVHKANGGYVFFKSVAMRDALTNGDDYFTVDIRTTSGFNTNSSNKGVKDGNDVQFFNADTGAMDGNRWIRLVVKKTNMNNATFLKFTATTECDIYIDNIQYHSGDDTSFEGNNITFDDGSYYYRGASKKLADNLMTNSAVYFQTNNSTSYFALSRTRATEGDQSLMFTKVTGSDINVYFTAAAKNALTSGATLSIDIWTTKSCTQMRNGRSTSSESEYVRTLDATTPYAWKTYVLTADDLTGDGRGIIITGSTSIGDWYFDNIVIA